MIDLERVKTLIKAVSGLMPEGQSVPFLERGAIQVNANLHPLGDGRAFFLLGKTRWKGKDYAIGELYDVSGPERISLGCYVMRDQGEQSVSVTDPVEIHHVYTAFESNGEDLLRPSTKEVAFESGTFMTFVTLRCLVDGESIMDVVGIIDPVANLLVDVSLLAYEDGKEDMIQVPEEHQGEIVRLCSDVLAFYHIQTDESLLPVK